MGVTGLHKLLQQFAETKHVSDFAGMRLGVDGYAWLHRAAASCAEDLYNRRDTPKLVQSIDNRIRLFEQNNVELFFVFDGVPLGMKSAIEQQRREKRQQAAKLGQSGARNLPKYHNLLSSLDITADHAAMVIALLKQRRIRYVVAPFEADSQMVWLESHGLVNGIISEDSDLLVFGAQKLLTKPDVNLGTFVELNTAKFPFHFRDLAHLRALAVVMGCDYCAGIHGLGPVKATALVQRMHGDLNAILRSLVADMRADSRFLATARKAELAFQYQQVWDVDQKQLTHLNELPSDLHTELLAELTEEVIGRELTRPEAHRIAVGAIDPHDLSRELVVTPLVAQYVSRCRPFAVKLLAKPKEESVLTKIDRRLSSFSSATAKPRSKNFSLVNVNQMGMVSEHWLSPMGKLAKPTKTESTKMETKIESTRIEPTKIETTEMETKIEPTKIEPTKIESTKVEPTKIETKMEPTKMELTTKVRSPFFAAWRSTKPHRESTETDTSFSLDHENTINDLDILSPSNSLSSNPSVSSLSSISSSPPKPALKNTSLTSASENLRLRKRQNSFQLARKPKIAADESPHTEANYVSESSDVEDVAITPVERLALLNRFRYVPK